MSVFLEIDDSSPHGEEQGSTYFAWSITQFCDEYLSHHKSPPGRRDAGPLRKEAAGVKPRWKRKMLFEFFGTPSLATR